MTTSPAGPSAAPRLVRKPAAVFAAALLLFAPAVTTFAARVTDISALRLLDGDVPYRDFWTMYAPGSFVTLSLAFAAFGRELIVSNALGVVTSAAAVAACFGLGRRAGGVAAGWILAALVAIAFVGTGYHDGFTSYPPALLLILLALNRVAARVADAGWRWAIVPGLLLGLAAVFKHDVAAYAAFAAALAIVAARAGLPGPSRLLPVVALAGAASAVAAIAVAALLALGAGRDAWDQLVVFPLTDFKHVRPEYFPLVPRLRGSPLLTAQELVHWSICNLPLAALVAGVIGVRGRWGSLAPGERFIGVFAFGAFWLHWWAAHVQLNTHAISLAAWGGLAAALGLARARSLPPRTLRASLAVVAVWSMALVAQPVYLAMTSTAGASELVGLPRLTGIRAPAANAAWMRDLAAAMERVSPPEAPLQLLGNRNDALIYAETVPYWLSARRPASRHHELHPGITDTAPRQREMIARLGGPPPAVIVREYRFPDDTIDRAIAEMGRHVAVGAKLLDEWVQQHYQPLAGFGPYELMQPRAAAPE